MNPKYSIKPGLGIIIPLMSFVFLFVQDKLQAQVPILQEGTVWKYWDQGYQPGDAWKELVYDDSAWPEGPSQLGYGEGDQATTVSYGPDPLTKYVTTWFRCSFNIPEASIYTGYMLRILRDDGVVVYLNGQEIMRKNLPLTPITPKTFAITAVAGEDESKYDTLMLAAGTLHNGLNQLAVEIHQANLKSSDISFDCNLVGYYQPLVPLEAVWKYNDSGTYPGEDWTALNYADTAWSEGPAELGYGDGDEATTVGFGPDEANKYIATWFRTYFELPDTNNFNGFLLNYKIDDGAVFYLNGHEIHRFNLPSGAIDPNTLTESTIGTAIENDYHYAFIHPEDALQGTNVLAVEVHQRDATSSDLSMSVELVGSNGKARLLRGPYLQSVLSTGITICWRTNIATIGKVAYGLSQDTLDFDSGESTATYDHVITLSGLEADRQYFYRIYSGEDTLVSSPELFFWTSPEPGSVHRTRVWVTGDVGIASLGQDSIIESYRKMIGRRYTDLWLLLGDNAYESGTDEDYQNGFFTPFADSKLLPQTTILPTPGNHDYDNSNVLGISKDIAYYDIFHLPQNGEAGGVPSGTASYYSFERANIHFVSLDCFGQENGYLRLYDTLSPQVVWLKQDLASNTLPWTVIYFHYPPYSKGNHDSDSTYAEVKLRQRLLPILERYKVDLVLCGHSHDYERSYLIKGHYGYSSEFSDANKVSLSSGKYDGSPESCPYVKNESTQYNGTVYVVTGSTGKIIDSFSTGTHPAMYYSNASQFGSFYFEVNDNRLDAKWVTGDGKTRDRFTIMKDAGLKKIIPLQAGVTVDLHASWTGDYVWPSTGSTLRDFQATPGANISYIVQDGKQCLADTFVLQVQNQLVSASHENLFSAFPNPVTYLLHVNSNFVAASGAISVCDAKGVEWYRGPYQQVLDIDVRNWPAGVYFVQWLTPAGVVIQKVIK